MAKGLDFNQGTCGYCGRACRKMFRDPNTGGKKNTKLQRTRWFVCENGHKIYRKRG